MRHNHKGQGGEAAGSVFGACVRHPVPGQSHSLLPCEMPTECFHVLWLSLSPSPVLSLLLHLSLLVISVSRIEGSIYGVLEEEVGEEGREREDIGEGGREGGGGGGVLISGLP